MTEVFRVGGDRAEAARHGGWSDVGRRMAGVANLPGGTALTGLPGDTLKPRLGGGADSRAIFSKGPRPARGKPSAVHVHFAGSRCESSIAGDGPTHRDVGRAACFRARFTLVVAKTGASIPTSACREDPERLGVR